MFVLFLPAPPPGERVLGPSEASPLGALRTEPGGLEVYGAALSSDSESRNQLSSSSSSGAEQSPGCVHLSVCFAVKFIVSWRYEIN